MITQHLRTLATLAAPLATPVERLTGYWLGSAEPAEIVIAGSPETTEFIGNALVRVVQREPVARLDSPLALRSKAFERICTRADLVAAEVPPVWQSLLPAGTRFRMPAWVSQEIQVPEGAELVLPAALIKEVQRHRRREGYAVEFSRDVGDVKKFYAELYRPYVAARFGPGAVVVDESRFLAVSRGMTLAALYAGGKRVAAMLFDRRGTKLSLGWFGAATQPPPSGASEVLDALVIEHAVAAGARRVILGHSRPSLADGVLRYKARFGAVILPTRFPQHVIGFRVQKPSPTLATALNAAQFVGFPRGQLRVCEISAGPHLSAGSPASASAR